MVRSRIVGWGAATVYKTPSLCGDISFQKHSRCMRSGNMKQGPPDCCADCEYRTDDCSHELRDELVVYFRRNLGSDCPCRG
jgi:hypothetical protein